MTKRPFVLHLVPHTRWHREGYQTFQRSRLRLVDLLDHLIDLLNRSDQMQFLLDGQVILVDDYLEVRPQQRAALVELVGRGKLHIGPWYVNPDPFLVSPEALVRNLLQGRHTSAQFGAWLNVGYLPDTSGHIGQMPQILRGFGVESVVVRDGLGEVPAELWWDSPDGSRVLLIYLRDGYQNAAQLPLDIDSLKAALGHARDSLKEHSSACELLMMNGADQQDAQAAYDEVIQEANRRFRGTRVVYSSLPYYVEQVLAEGDKFPTVVGELRSPQRFVMGLGVLSTRMWLKQRNHTAQQMLERWAEPFSTWATLIGSTEANHPDKMIPLRSQADLLTHAWRILLQNQAVDSIRGTSCDQVHREMIARFDQVEQIAQEIIDQNLCYLAQQINTQALPIDGPAVPIVVFNATGQPHTDLVTFEMVLPDFLRPFEVIDESGTVLPSEMLIAPTPLGHGNDKKDETITVRFVAQDVPSFGYRTYALRPAHDAPAGTVTVDDQGLSIENEMLSLSVTLEEGTLALFDKRTGRSFSGLNRYVDGGDRGDAFSFCAPQRDTVIDVPTNAPLHVIRLVGPVTQTLETFQIYRLPETLTEDQEARLPLAAQFVPVSVTTTITITRSVPRIDIEATIVNSARDHRLRVHFPTGVIGQQALFDGHFEVVQRDIALPAAEDTVGWAEQPATEQPQRAFTTVLGSETGLTIANRGLPEVAVLATVQGIEIALTLLRCIGWLSRETVPNRRDNAGPQIAIPEAQCQGEYTFVYSIIPHSADPLPAWHEAWAFETPLRVQITDVHPGRLPLTGSLVTTDNPRFVVSAIKAAAGGQGIIVRGYNLSHEAEHVTLHTDVPFEQAKRVTLDESTVIEEIRLRAKGHKISFEARPAEIVTVRLHPPTPR